MVWWGDWALVLLLHSTTYIPCYLVMYPSLNLLVVPIFATFYPFCWECMCCRTSYLDQWTLLWWFIPHDKELLHKSTHRGHVHVHVLVYVLVHMHVQVVLLDKLPWPMDPREGANDEEQIYKSTIVWIMYYNKYCVESLNLSSTLTSVHAELLNADALQLRL